LKVTIKKESAMQTFLPYPDFVRTARVLDYRRLGKQRVETKQLILALTQPKYGWKNHPAAKMWVGHVPLLAEYGRVICQEWIDRGYNDSLLPFFSGFDDVTALPPWLGDESVHASHRSNLLRKDMEFYSQWGWTDPIDLPYVWPV
jgi:hypothetical protein